MKNSSKSRVGSFILSIVLTVAGMSIGFALLAFLGVGKPIFRFIIFILYIFVLYFLIKTSVAYIKALKDAETKEKD